MLLAVALSCLIAAIGARGGSGVPGRLQALAEMAYEFIAGMVRSAAGEHGMRFFPLVFSIFFFILICNLVGLIPYSFTVTSQIIITAALALMVFFTVVIIGIKEHGTGLLQAVRARRACRSTFCRWSWRSRSSRSCRARQPFGPSVRQHARRPHHAQRVRRRSSSCCSAPAPATGVLAILPFAMTIGLYALELLVAFLQAYVFAMLTCMYLNDALHPGGH